jgi:predicted MFS family arabinose efflux permease
VAIKPSRRRRAQTVINCGTGLGVAASAPVALLAATTWRAAWLVFAVLAAAVPAWSARALPAAAPSGSGTRWRIPHLLPAGVRTVLIGAGLVGLTTAVYWTFALALVVEAGGLTPGRAAAFWFTVGVAGLAGGLAGDVVQRIGVPAALRIGWLLLATAIALVAIDPGSTPGIFASAVLFGAAHIALTGIVLVWALGVFPRQPALGAAVAFLAFAVGQILGAPLAGALTDRVGLTVTFFVYAGVATLGVLIAPSVTTPKQPPPASRRRLPRRRSHRRGHSLAEALAVSAAGSVAGPAAAGWLATALGLDGTFLAMAVPTAAAAAVLGCARSSVRGAE